MAQGFVNDRTTDYLSLKSRLIDSASNRQRAEHFDSLNRHLRPGLVTPGRLAGSAVGAAAIGKLGSKLALRACVMVLGISMKASGQLACGIVGGAAGGYAGGSRGGDSGAFFGGKVLEISGELIFQPEGA